jgi:hypothetical protein
MSATGLWMRPLLFSGLPQLARQWDSRTLRIAVLIWAVAFLNVIDLVYTVFANHLSTTSQHELFREGNPLAAVFLNLGLIPSLICFKILMVSCGLGLLWKVRRSLWAVPACWVLVATYMGLAVMWCMWMRDATAAMEIVLTSATP